MNIDINKMYCEKNLETMARLEDNSIDSIVTDAPYGLSFMGAKWDYDVPGVEIWRECLRVLKPGGYLLCFAGTRTQHRMTINIEDAGFEIRDMIAWVYGSGFPKSHNISNAIDKHLGAERKKDRIKYSENVLMKSYGNNNRPWMDEAKKNGYHEVDSDEAVTDEGKVFDGFGTALKPAFEPITVARKPIEKSVAFNVLKYGTGGINIDGCRVGESGGCKLADGEGGFDAGTVNALGGNLNSARSGAVEGLGRFPANLIHDGSEEVLQMFPVTTSGARKKTDKLSVDQNGHKPSNIYGKYAPKSEDRAGNSGSASRFFYTAKASKEDRGKWNDHPNR